MPPAATAAQNIGAAGGRRRRRWRRPRWWRRRQWRRRRRKRRPRRRWRGARGTLGRLCTATPDVGLAVGDGKLLVDAKGVAASLSHEVGAVAAGGVVVAHLATAAPVRHLLASLHQHRAVSQCPHLLGSRLRRQHRRHRRHRCHLRRRRRRHCCRCNLSALLPAATKAARRAAAVCAMDVCGGLGTPRFARRKGRIVRLRRRAHRPIRRGGGGSGSGESRGDDLCVAGRAGCRGEHGASYTRRGAKGGIGPLRTAGAVARHRPRREGDATGEATKERCRGGPRWRRRYAHNLHRRRGALLLHRH